MNGFSIVGNANVRLPGYDGHLRRDLALLQGPSCWPGGVILLTTMGSADRQSAAAARNLGHMIESDIPQDPEQRSVAWSGAA